MDAQKIFHNKQFEIFKSQDLEAGFFDVTFEIEGKRLYADKFRLAAVSTVFQSLFTEKWKSKDEPIESKRNNFEDFKDFLTFIFSGECNFTNENVFTMADIAEYYNVEVLKNICKKFLSNIWLTDENAFQFLELAIKYSLKNLKERAFTYFLNKFAALTNCNKFLSLDRTSVKELIIFVENKINAESIFNAICKWGEHQAEIKKTKSNDPNFNLNDAIKNEFSEFLPHIQFRQMNLNFLHKSVVPKAFIFSSLQELSDILSYSEEVANQTISKQLKLIGYLTVKATSPNGEILQGVIPSNNYAVKFINALKNSPSLYRDGRNSFWWSETCAVPRWQYGLKKKDDIKWYLVNFSSSVLGIIHHSKIYHGHYLIAEMFSEGIVKASAGWKIEIN